MVTTALRLSAYRLPAWKRGMDLALGGIVLFLSAPLFALCWAAVRLTSPGPALHWSRRVGKDNRLFDMPKFRTMHIGAPQVATHLLPQPKSYLTPIGALLRKTSLDELPQLFNVFIGEMSLVGPRPFFEADFSEYEDRHFRRLDAKPGITGLWQVSGRSEVLDFEDVIFLDRQYIEQWSFWLDVSILFRTIPAVLRRTGAF